MKVSRRNRFDGSGISGQPTRAIEASCTIADWPERDPLAIRAIREKWPGLVDLWESSPVMIHDNTPQTEEFVDALFPGNPLLCCASFRHKFGTRLRSNWHKMEGLQFIVPNPMTAKVGKTQQGKLSEHTKENTGRRRFLVIDQDDGELDQQAAILLHLAEIAPMALAMHSGGKSLHGWFYCGDKEENDLRRFMQYAVSLGADRQMWKPSQFARMPDGLRNLVKRQCVYFFNPEVI